MVAPRGRAPLGLRARVRVPRAADAPRQHRGARHHARHAVPPMHAPPSARARVAVCLSACAFVFACRRRCARARRWRCPCCWTTCVDTALSGYAGQMHPPLHLSLTSTLTTLARHTASGMTVLADFSAPDGLMLQSGQHNAAAGLLTPLPPQLFRSASPSTAPASPSPPSLREASAAAPSRRRASRACCGAALLRPAAAEAPALMTTAAALRSPRLRLRRRRSRSALDSTPPPAQRQRRSATRSSRRLPPPPPSRLAAARKPRRAKRPPLHSSAGCRFAAGCGRRSGGAGRRRWGRSGTGDG